MCVFCVYQTQCHIIPLYCKEDKHLCIRHNPYCSTEQVCSRFMGEPSLYLLKILSQVAPEDHWTKKKEVDFVQNVLKVFPINTEVISHFNLF